MTKHHQNIGIGLSHETKCQHPIYRLQKYKKNSAENTSSAKLTNLIKINDFPLFISSPKFLNFAK